MPALAAPIAAPAMHARRPADQPLRVAFVGNIGAREKGAHKLLALWRRLQPQDMQLTFYGTNADRLGPLSDVRNVRAAGPFRPDEISRVFGEIDLLVHPADDESLGLVLVEAMAHGVPFVGTHVGGIIDIAQDNPHVLTIANTEAALEAAILAMKARIQDGQLDHAGLRALYEARWSHEALGERWARLYL
jgi:glycosyltransferase involved in cell wall biosynthesis